MPTSIAPHRRLGAAIKEAAEALRPISVSVRIDATVAADVRVAAQPMDAERLGSAHAAMTVARLTALLKDALREAGPLASERGLSRIVIESVGRRPVVTLRALGVEMAMPIGRAPRALAQLARLVAEGAVPPAVAPALPGDPPREAWVAEVVPTSAEHPSRLKTRVHDAATAFRVLLWDEALEAHLTGSGPVRLTSFGRADGAPAPDADSAALLARCAASPDPIDRLIAAAVVIGAADGSAA